MEEITKYRKNPSVVSTELDDGAVLLNLDTKYYYNLNVTGFRIWQALEDTLSPSLIATEFANEYETDIDRVTLSLARLIEELEKEGLIIVDGSTR
jgi:hypothetical protein